MNKACLQKTDVFIKTDGTKVASYLHNLSIPGAISGRPTRI